MSETHRCRPRADPGCTGWLRSNAIEHAEPGGVSCTTRKSSPARWGPAARIRATGRAATVVSLPGDGTGDLAAQAATLDAAVTAERQRGAPSVDVIGYSAGGVVARLWVARYTGAQAARRVVTLGSPLHGAQLAATGPAPVPR